MSLWIFTGKNKVSKKKIGTKYKLSNQDDLFIAEIAYKVQPTILIRNYNARLRNLPTQPEIPEQCIRLIGAQINLFQGE